MRANSRMPVLPEFLSLNKVYYIIIITRLQQSSDFWLDNWYWQWHLDSPSGVLGELEASSEPRLRESVLLKNKSATFIICLFIHSSPHISARISVLLIGGEYLDVFIKVQHLLLGAGPPRHRAESPQRGEHPLSITSTQLYQSPYILIFKLKLAVSMCKCLKATCKHRVAESLFLTHLLLRKWSLS